MRVTKRQGGARAADMLCKGGALIQWINHTCFIVEDMEQSLAFYRDILGMRVERTEERHAGKAGDYSARLFGQPNVHYLMVYLGIGDQRHAVELVQFSDPPSRHLEGGRPIDVGSGHLGFIVDDLEEVYRHLSAHGVEFLTPPQEREDDPSYPWSRKGVFARDPDGNWLEFLERPPAPPGTDIV